MSNHTITDTIDGKAITAEEFLRQARRWAAMVRGAAKRNTLQFTKGKKITSITMKSGKVERRLRDSIQYRAFQPYSGSGQLQNPHSRNMEGVGCGLWPAESARQVCEPASPHTPLNGGLA